MNQRLFQTNEVLKYLQPNPVIANPSSRLGSKNDGGYVVIKDFSKSDFLISMGVADDINFEAEISSLVAGIDLYDDSIQSLPGEISNGRFFKERIGKFPNISVADAMLRTGHTQDLILKMDIEGSEWEVLSQLSLTDLLKFRQLIIEFHFLANSLEPIDYESKISVLRKLAENFYILNSHPNNCGDLFVIENLLLPDVIEVTYVRKNSYSLEENSCGSALRSVESLNRPCSEEFPEIYLPRPITKNLLHLETRSSFEFSRLKYESVMRDRNDIALRLLSTSNEREALIREREALIREREALIREREANLREEKALRSQIQEILSSRIWRCTRLYRRMRSR
jgi:hypothetical protein